MISKHQAKTHLMAGAALALLMGAGAASAQDVAKVQTLPTASSQAAPAAAKVQEIEVVGTRIQGAKITAALPVTVVTADQVAATGAITGDDILRSIPEMGAVTFNPSNTQQTNNSARGDIGSIDLRNAGLGDTLVLLNGRRIVAYPTSQSHGNIPLISYNSESLPMAGLQRLEVLRDGAGAIYGSDAVAGVVNVVTRTDFNGLKIDLQNGFAEGAHRQQYDQSLFAGHDFAGGKGNISLSFEATERTAQYPSDEPFTANQDLRSYFANTPGYSTSSTPDGRGTQGSWPALVALGLTGAVKQGATSLTTAAGSFHIQPSTLPGCATQIGNSLCIGTGTVPYGTTANILRYNAVANDYLTVAPAIGHQIAQLNAHYDVGDDLTVYGEFDYFNATSHGLTTQGTALVPIGIPASNYYNPLGPVTFANGQANPNRLPNLTNVPAAGAPVTFATYRFNDLGPDAVDVSSYQDRFLAGAKGRLGNWAWDSALLYGEAQATDVSGSISSPALARQLALSTPDAYDPFNGSCLNGAGGGDCNPSTTAALDAIRIKLTRRSKTSLANADFKLTNSDLFNLPGGALGVATGIEFRRETHSDIRDPYVNGSMPFTDPVTGLVSASSATGVNVTPSTSGSRDVFSAYGEFAVPVISPEMHIPLVRSVDLQLAGRYEHYSDFGNVAKPKVAGAWDVIDGIRFRASWQQGFKAPNLETTAPFTFARAQTVTDWYRCQADLNTHRISSFGACTESVGVTYNESGNPQLSAETSESTDLGLVLQPTFMADRIGRFTVTIDRWRLQQNGVLGVVGPTNIAIQDYVSRMQGSGGVATVQRNAPTADDVAAFAGSGLAPVGTITQLSDTFQNMQPQTISGWDFSIEWRRPTEHYGLFDVNFAGTYLDKYFQPPTTAVQALFAARGSGVINVATPLTGSASEIGALANPRFRMTTTMTWKLAQYEMGGAVNYTSATQDTAFLSTTGVPYPVKSMTTVDLYGQYTFKGPRLGNGLKMKLGVRNLMNTLPPIESDGYNGSLYVPYGRYVYLNLGISF
ncbi:MAG TPA: TonB-dependent receptor [Caulobacteraceae bacterium]|jgi:outer membrane receptor protein involved in Fe transport